MMEIKGKNGVAKVFTDLIEATAKEQVKNMLDNEITESTVVRIMPDVHAGKGSTIGTTIKMPENFADWKVSPNVVGVDVGCGILMYKLAEKSIDLEILDNFANELIPTGFKVHNKPQDEDYTNSLISQLNVKADADRIAKSLGTLGGGNHFIELGQDENGDYWLSVHSGSRNLGVQVASQHQEIAETEENIDIEKIINELKAQGRHNEIQSTLEKLKALSTDKTADKTLSYVQGEDLMKYLHDMKLAQGYAKKNRETMLDILVSALGLTVVDSFDSIHNFIEYEERDGEIINGIIRKGATSAKEGERLVIPLNMRDGSLIARGKGNKDWNESAPHGAGRMMSRNQARKELSLESFKEQMSGIHSTSVVKSTLDEAPDAYKPAEVIKENIKDTVDVVHIVKPVWNFKAK